MRRPPMLLTGFHAPLNTIRLTHRFFLGGLNTGFNDPPALVIAGTGLRHKSHRLSGREHIH